MSNEKTGRNDPCPCGRGKKYKRCCLAADERRSATGRPSALPLDSDAPTPTATLDVRRIPELLRDLERNVPDGERGEIKRWAAEIKPVVAYLEQQVAIAAAAAVLEAHRSKFEQLTRDEPAYQQRIRTLFAEERFLPLRFTAEDVRRAFDHTGQPANLATDERILQVLRAAILYLADKRRRSQLAVSLMLHLPADVTAGRILDAWIIQHCALLTSDAPDDSNPFLFEMFSYGYEAWTDEQEAGRAAMLSALGITLPHLQRMSMPEIDAWLEEQKANPELRARLEATLRDHPGQQSMAITNYEETQRNSITLLQREDAASLLLSPDELEPWLPRLNDFLESVRDELPQPADFARDPAAGDVVLNALLPVLGEMAGTVFTPARRQQLAAQLKLFRNDRFAAGDKRNAAYAQAAATFLEAEDHPARNHFLITVCFMSLRGFSATQPDDHE